MTGAKPHGQGTAMLTVDVHTLRLIALMHQYESGIIKNLSFANKQPVICEAVEARVKF